MRHRRLLWLGAILMAGLWLALLGATAWVRHDLNRGRPTTPASAAGSVTFWDAPPFAFTDQDGHRTTDADLRGHPYVADFIFTTCTTACPTLTAQLALLRRQLRSPEARFVSFSVDPAHDTPAALHAYAGLWGSPDPRWRLLSTDPAGLAAVVKGFRVTVAPSGDPDNPILHSTLFILVDANGTVRGIYDSTDSDAVARLATDLRALAGAGELLAPAAPTATDAVARGRQVYAAMGCIACHGQPRVAPPLASVFNSMVRLSDGTTVWADEAYLHESIANPAAKIVAGYMNTMPSYRGHLSDGQTADVVAYVESLSTNPPGGHGVVSTRKGVAVPPTAIVVDPVCHMSVAVNPAGPRETVGGRTFYFCSDACRETFNRNPARYATAVATKPSKTTSAGSARP
jgi:protein SCO1/2